MRIETSKEGVFTRLLVGEQHELALDVPRHGVVELLPDRTESGCRLLVRGQGGAILSEHEVHDD